MSPVWVGREENGVQRWQRDPFLRVFKGELRSAPQLMATGVLCGRAARRTGRPLTKGVAAPKAARGGGRALRGRAGLSPTLPQQGTLVPFLTQLCFNQGPRVPRLGRLGLGHDFAVGLLSWRPPLSAARRHACPAHAA